MCPDLGTHDSNQCVFAQKGKYLTNAFEGEPEDLTVEEMTTLEDQVCHGPPL